MSIKYLLMACAMLALTAISFAVSPAMAAPPPGSCIGGCLPTALAAPTPVFPVDYQCRKNWPLGEWYGSCIDPTSANLFGKEPIPHLPDSERVKR